MKYKQISVLFYLLFISFFLTNCKSTKVKNSPKDAIKMIFEYNNTKSSFVGNDYTKPLTWEYKSDKIEYLFKENVTLNISDLKSILVLEKSKNHIKYKLNDDVYEFKNIHKMNNYYSWIIIGSKSKIHFQVYDKTGSLKKFLDGLEPNDKISMRTQGCPPCILFGAAVLVATIVDFVCDKRIANEVKKCTDNGKCSVVNTCGATCIDCTK